MARVVCALVLIACGPASSIDAGSEDSAVHDAGRFDAGRFDAGRFDAGRFDAGETSFAIGAASVAQRPYSSQPPTGTLDAPAIDVQAGSMIIASVARGVWESAPDAPSGATFTLVGTEHAYGDWPTARTGLYAASGVAGGAQSISMTWGDIGGTGDEVTLSVVEVRGATRIEDHAWVERSAASTITSESVTTSGPALLLAWWWGSGGVRSEGDLHVAMPGDGFTVIPEATALRSLSNNGYVQVAVAYRVVDSAGDYTVTWTTDNEGAQLYLLALSQ